LGVEDNNAPPLVLRDAATKVFASSLFADILTNRSVCLFDQVHADAEWYRMLANA
jgi:Rad3-related DNA helicase